MNRLHPFPLAFGEIAESRFPVIRAECPSDDVDLATMARLPSTLSLVRDMLAPGSDEPDPQLTAEYLSITYAAFRYWSGGQHTLHAEKERLTIAIAAPPDSEPSVPHGACYVELPQHWIWAAIGSGAPYEPLEGFFAISAKAGSEMAVVAVLGLRPERDGFSQITVTATPSDVFATADSRRDPPFAPLMDGGTEAGFLSVANEGELLHLCHLALQTAAE